MIPPDTLRNGTRGMGVLPMKSRAGRPCHAMSSQRTCMVTSLASHGHLGHEMTDEAS